MSLALQSGHYTAFVRHPCTGSWVYCDDSYISQVPSSGYSMCFITVYGKTRHRGFSKCENQVWCIIDKLYPRADSSASLGHSRCFAQDIAYFVHDLATHVEMEKLRSEGVAMYAYSISICYVWTGNQLNGHEQGHSKWTQDRARLEFHHRYREAVLLRCLRS